MPPLARPQSGQHGVPSYLGPVDQNFEYSVGGEVNSFVFFRLAWDPTLDPGLITQEYAQLTFGRSNALAASTASNRFTSMFNSLKFAFCDGSAIPLQSIE